MTNNKSFFDTLEKEGIKNVAVANGQVARIMGDGSGNLNFLGDKNKEIKIKLKDDLYVPELTERLLSVKRLVDMGFEILFKGQVCEITKGNAIVATICASSNTYSVTRNTWC